MLKLVCTICDPLVMLFHSNKFTDIGVVTSLEVNHKPVEIARKGVEVCLKIEPVGGEAPRLYGRHFDHTDIVVSKASILLFPHCLSSKSDNIDYKGIYRCCQKLLSRRFTKNRLAVDDRTEENISNHVKNRSLIIIY